MKQPASLARENALLLSAAFVLLTLLVSGLSVWWVWLPLGRQSADDLAGLMVLSAQTWAELPPATRPAFEEELMRSHVLALRDVAPTAAPDQWHAPYFYLLEAALVRRTGLAVHLSRELQDSGTWYWASVPTGIGVLGVGVAAQRIPSQPMLALGLALVVGGGLALLLALWLARRLTRPLAQLEAATTLIGQGGQPALLPETGPRELRALSRRFNAMAQQVDALLSARTTLLAGVSHDLRTPLARMRLALEMLRDDPQTVLFDRVERDIEHMDRLLGNVLDLARGLTHEPPQSCDLNALLQQLALDFSSPAQAVQVTCPPGLQVQVSRTALQRALGNLLQNALRYAPGGPVDLVAEAREGQFRLGVLDRGPGIAPELREAVLQPFFRIESSRSPQTGGAGLGLAIVQSLARANGWQFSLGERLGGGLEAWLVIHAAPGRP